MKNLLHAIAERITGEPALAAGAVMAIINLLLVFGVLELTSEQIGAINTALAAVLAFVVRRSVTPDQGKPLQLARRHAPVH